MSSTPAIDELRADTQMAVRSISWRHMAAGALLLVYFGLWLHLTPYGGLGHDAQAYAFEALAELRPVPFAQDVFLQYRSQEEFTIFPTVYAGLIELFGLETTAVALVLLCQLLWYGFAYLLLRRLLGSSTALFSLGLLVTLSGTYGGFRVFHMAEPFLTARLPGEVLSLAGLWLYASDRKILAAVTMLLAMAVHPLMAFPGAALLCCVEVGRRGPWHSATALLVVGVIAAFGGSYLLGGEDPHMTGRWLAVTHLRSGFLFLNYWRPIDWNDTLVTLLTLGLAGFTLKSLGAMMARSALGLAIAGLVLTAITSFLLPLEVLIQGQPWRWLWIARFLAIGLLPATIFALWSDGWTGRGCAMLLVSAWLFVVPVTAEGATIMMLGTILSVLALVTWTARAHIAQYGRFIFGGSAVVLAAVAISSFGTISLAAAVMFSGGEPSSSAGTSITNILKLLTPATFIAIGTWLTACVRPGRWAPIALVAIAGALVLSAWPNAWAEWTARSWSGTEHEKFADWRAKIPVESEVFWYDSLRETWFLLERRAYLTRSQSGGIVFSEGLADEVVRRAMVLEPYIDPNFWIITGPSMKAEPNPLSAEIMRSICRDPELGHIVSEDYIGSAVAAKEWPEPDQYIYLYDCRMFRSGTTE